ncbi:hypothetical protein [Streptomyces sp. NPDC017673]|uniref:hypothetical protein n=1 Tax=unclassified Streptomyces TaxID=2593676 RepID=UPI00379F83A0
MGFSLPPGDGVEARFAALPVLTEIATGRQQGSSWEALAPAGRIVVEEQQLHEPGYVQARYPAAINELHRLTRNHVMVRPFQGDEDDFLYWLEHLLAFEGVPVWRHSLRRSKHPLVCPSCPLSLEADLAHERPGTRRWERDAAGQSAVAGRVTCLFGRATCPDCASQFPVPDQIA